MKTCPKCNAQMPDDAKFCYNCGLEFEKKSTKLPNLYAKKQKMEKENADFIKKASLQNEDIQDAPTLDVSYIQAQQCGSLKNNFHKSILMCVLMAIVIVACVVGFFLLSNWSNDNEKLMNNVKIFSLIAMFFIIAICLSHFIDNFYKARVFYSMRNSQFAIKKVGYAQPPIMNCNGKLFKLSVNYACPICNSPLHIEEMPNQFVAVCNKDRGHILTIDSVQLKEKFLNNIQ